MVNGSIINKIKLPNILVEDEFNYYHKKFLNGDYKSLEVLVLHNLKLVYWYIDKYINSLDISYDDVFSVGVEALIESIYNYDVNKSSKFSAYAIRAIRDKISKYFRSENIYNKYMILHLDDYILDDVDSDTFGDMIFDSFNIEDEIIDLEMNTYYKEIINKIIYSLNDIDREIVKLYFGFYNGRVHSQREICEMLGLSQSQISKRLSKTLKYIKGCVLFDEVSNKEYKTFKLVNNKIA